MSKSKIDLDKQRKVVAALKEGEDATVCFACASAAGGDWPEDHVATAGMYKCDVCGRVESCCALSDWDWSGLPNGRRMASRREL